MSKDGCGGLCALALACGCALGGPAEYVFQDRRVLCHAMACLAGCDEDTVEETALDDGFFDASIGASAFVGSKSSPAAADAASGASQVSLLGEWIFDAAGSAMACASDFKGPVGTGDGRSDVAVVFRIDEAREVWARVNLVGSSEDSFLGTGGAMARLSDSEGDVFLLGATNDEFGEDGVVSFAFRGVLVPGNYTLTLEAEAVMESAGPTERCASATYSMVLGFCAMDFDGDGAVGSDDLNEIIGMWGSDDAVADVNSDGVVSSKDLSMLLGSWGACE